MFLIQSALFSNRNGGHIFLGVNDQKEIVGVNEDKVDKIIKDFTNSINSPQKNLSSSLSCS